MITQDALSRTILLMRDYLDAPDDALLDGLLGTTVLLASDAENLQSHSAQTAYFTAATLMARSGASVFLSAPDVPLIGKQPPSNGTHLIDSLVELGNDLIPGVPFRIGEPRQPADLGFVLGTTHPKTHARETWRFGGGECEGWLEPFSVVRSAIPADWPLGGLAAGGLVAAEAFKGTMRKLSNFALNVESFAEVFAPSARAEFALRGVRFTKEVIDFGFVDAISAGAVTHAFFFALARIPKSRGEFRVIEPQISDLSNLNRYELLRRSRLNTSKAEDLASLDLGGLKITPVVERFPHRIRGLSSSVIVGVDDIPTRWSAQAAAPGWLGVGATTHFSAMVTEHVPGLPCSGCAHPKDDPGELPIPTAAFVSHWAGLLLAGSIVARASGQRVSPSEQQTYFSPLRSDSVDSVFRGPVPLRSDCPLRCRPIETTRLA
jgi:hypothetical protein